MYRDSEGIWDRLGRTTRVIFRLARNRRSWLGQEGSLGAERLGLRARRDGIPLTEYCPFRAQRRQCHVVRETGERCRSRESLLFFF
jgi:hypothetical protein